MVIKHTSIKVACIYNTTGSPTDVYSHKLPAECFTQGETKILRGSHLLDITELFLYL